jgi:tetratricopeptide (TPR) repeat protein
MRLLTSINRIRRTKIQREAEGYLELGMPQHALDALAGLGDPAAFDPHTLYLWGEALRATERYPEAIVPLGQAAEAVPENVDVWFALGWCYKRTGRVDLAIDSLEKALAIAPNEALVHFNLACYWSLAGNHPRALEYLSRALTIDPHYRQLIDDEPDFDPLRCDPEFQALCAGSGTTG